ncbi:unnamed protein product [Rotaria sp. Silwood1]|nr:unnamed protein product [Rotaria sp. Silwood1]
MARTNPHSTLTIKKPYHNLFDMIDETNDGLQFSKDTLNQYFLSGQLPSITYTEEIVDDTILHAFEHNELSEQEQDDQDDDETILSQKLSQLSTAGHAEVYPSATMDRKRRSSSRPSPAVCSKRMKISDYNADDDDDDDSLNVDDIKQNHIPNYLSMNSTTFVRLCKNLLKTVPTMTMNDVQQLALLMHQIGALRIKEEMSHIYLKSVTGTLTEPECDLIEVDRRVWPMQVQALVLSKRPFSSITTTEINQAEQQTTSSFLRDKYHMYFGDLLERLKVDLSILDYNYTRLNQFMRMLAYEQMRVFNIQAQEIQRINEKEYPIALEFFLKFDVNLFYMKTCSFRHARPRTLNEGLFCVQEPEARYELAACGNCGLCYPQYDMRYRSKKSIVEFAQAHTHTFVNGYQAILNCSATCHTRNIIYVLTCPCGKYDYVGATMYSLQDRLMKHREHGNRIIHEFLIGQKNVLRDLPRGKTKEVIAKDRMKLYQHSARCPVAMQIFLDANPQYWRFVPMTLEESQRPEQQSIEQPVISDEPNWTLRSKGDCRVCVEAVPKPLNGYTFSNRQIMLQTQYFHKLRDKTLPNQDIDLYNASIVAVLPESCSDMFRFTIESLFITYADAKLNSIGNVLNENQNDDHYPMNDPWFVRNSEWCQGLLRRPEPKITIST